MQGKGYACDAGKSRRRNPNPQRRKATQSREQSRNQELGHGGEEEPQEPSGRTVAPC